MKEEFNPQEVANLNYKIYIAYPKNEIIKELIRETRKAGIVRKVKARNIAELRKYREWTIKKLALIMYDQLSLNRLVTIQDELIRQGVGELELFK